MRLQFLMINVFWGMLVIGQMGCKQKGGDDGYNEDDQYHDDKNQYPGSSSYGGGFGSDYHNGGDCPGCSGGALKLSFNTENADALITSDTSSKASLVSLESTSFSDSNLQKLNLEGEVEDVVAVDTGDSEKSMGGNGGNGYNPQMSHFQVKKAKFNPYNGDLFIAMEWPIWMQVDYGANGKQDTYCGFVRVKADGTFSCVKDNFRFESWSCGDNEDVNVFDFDMNGNVYFLGVEENFEGGQGGQPVKMLYQMAPDDTVKALTNENQQIFTFHTTKSGAIFFKGSNSENCWEDSFLRIITPADAAGNNSIKRVSMPSGSHIQFFNVDQYDDLVFSISTNNGKNLMKKISYDADFNVVNEVNLSGEGNFGWPEMVKFDDKGRIFMILQTWGCGDTQTNAKTLYMVSIKHNPITGKFFSEMVPLTNDAKESVKAFGIVGDTIYYTGEHPDTSDPFFKKRLIGDSKSYDVVENEELEIYNFFVGPDANLYFSALSFDTGEYFIANIPFGETEYIKTEGVGKISDFEFVNQKKLQKTEIPAATLTLPDSYLMVAEPPQSNQCWGPQSFKLKLIDLTKDTDNVYTMASGLAFESNGNSAAKFNLIRHTDSQIFVNERSWDSGTGKDTLYLVDIIKGEQYKVTEHEDTGSGPLQLFGQYEAGKYLVRKGGSVKVLTVSEPSLEEIALADEEERDPVAVVAETSAADSFGVGYYKFFPNWWGELQTNSIIKNKMLYAVQKPDDNQPVDYYKKARVMVYNLDDSATISVRRRYTKTMKPLTVPLQTNHCEGETYYFRFADGDVDMTNIEFCTNYDAATGICTDNNGVADQDWLAWADGVTYPQDPANSIDVGGTCKESEIWTNDVTRIDTNASCTNCGIYNPVDVCPESPYEPNMDWSPSNSGNPTSVCNDYNLASTVADFDDFVVRSGENAQGQVTALFLPAKLATEAGASTTDNGFIKISLDPAKVAATTNSDGIVTGESELSCTGYDLHKIQNFYVASAFVYIVDVDSGKKENQISVLQYAYDGTTCTYVKTVANEMLNGVLDFFAK